MTELKIVLEFGECNGFMASECFINDRLVLMPPISTSNEVVLDVIVELPFNVTIKVSGKNLSTDTIVKDGKIIQDKYVKIKNIYLSRYPVNDEVLDNLCQFTPVDKAPEHNNYLYCDGTAVLQFQALDAVRWHLMHNKY